MKADFSRRKQGTPEDLLRFWVGHGDKTVTDRYAKLRQDAEFRKAVAERAGIGFSLEVVPQTSSRSQLRNL